MKKTIRYGSIKEIKYVFEEYDIRNAMLEYLKRDSMFTNLSNSEFKFEFGERDNGNFYLEILNKKTTIEKEEGE